MAIADIPPTYDEFERHNVGYERADFRRADTSVRVARVSRDMFVASFPGVPKTLDGYAAAQPEAAHTDAAPHVSALRHRGARPDAA